MGKYFLETQQRKKTASSLLSVINKLITPSLEGESIIEMPTLKYYFVGFPGGSEGKESACNAGNLSSMPGSGRSSNNELLSLKILKLHVTET